MNNGQIVVNRGTLSNTGIWLDQASADTGIYLQFNAASFNNSGSYVKSGGSTTDVSTINFRNTGTTDVQAGTLR